MSSRPTGDSGQLFLIPSGHGYWLPEDHHSRFIDEFVETKIDLRPFLSSCNHGKRLGRPGYNPIAMLKILIYGYSMGIYSSRELEKACVERIDFRFLCGGIIPSDRTICNFRKENIVSLAKIFHTILEVVVDSEMVYMEYLAFDGTKVLANASKRKAMSFERMTEELPKVTQEIEALKPKRRGLSQVQCDKIDKEIEFKRNRQAKIQSGIINLEERTQREFGRPPEAKEQINFTDPESRIMKKGSGFEQCYNAQIAVDRKHQVIVAAFVTQACNDKQMLHPLVTQTLSNLGLLPDKGLADAGYFSEATAGELRAMYHGTQWYIPPNRMKHGEKQPAVVGRIPKGITNTNRMRRFLRTKPAQAVYKQRKAIVEPVFGQIKEAVMDFRRFSMRGYDNAQNEWLFVCAVHNLLKLMRNWKKSKASTRQTNRFVIAKAA